MGYLNKKQSYFLIILCFLVYTAGYIGRLNYSASLVEIISAYNSDKTAGGLVSSFFFFAYGTGQLVNGILSKRYNPRIMLTLSLISAAVINFFMPFAGGLKVMKWLWLCNGFVQSILWCTIIKTLSKYIPDTILPKAILIMSTTVAIGTFCAYGLSAIGIAAGNWRFVFFVAAGVLSAVGLLWFFSFGYLKRQVGSQGGEEALQNADATSQGEGELADTPPQIKARKKFKITGYLVLLLSATVFAAVANGFVKDGTVTWTPSVFYEKFGLNKSFSVILTLSLPLLSVSGAFIVSFLHKRNKNFQLLTAIFYAVAIVCLALLILVCLPANALFPSLILFMIIACCMAAVNNILTAMIPLYLRGKMNSGSVAGIINTFCYVGSTLSAVLLGYVADASGWTAVFVVMSVFAAAALALNLAAAFIRKKQKH